MGKGDKKSKRGKIWRGSYGKSRGENNKRVDKEQHVRNNSEQQQS